MSIPYHDAISIGEDNSAAQIIAHASKLTRNVRHIATKTQALQENVCHGRVHFTRVSLAHNLADHFTKALPYYDGISIYRCRSSCGRHARTAWQISSLTIIDSTPFISFCYEM